MSKRVLVKEPLEVAPELVGADLAQPWRRFVAFAIDLVAVLLPTVFLAIGIALLSLRIEDPRGFWALRTMFRGETAPATEREAALRDLAPVLVRIEAPGLPAAVAVAVEEGDRERAGKLLDGVDFLFVLAVVEEGRPEARPRSGQVIIELGQFIHPALRAAALLGVAALYFTLLTRSRRGATFGKRLLGIRVVRLDGHRLTIWESFERFVGYLHIPGSLGITLIDLWHDPNRRQSHDRAAHTAVVRERRRQMSGFW